MADAQSNLHFRLMSLTYKVRDFSLPLKEKTYSFEKAG